MPWYEKVFYVLTAGLFVLALFQWLGVTPKHFAPIGNKIAGALRRWASVMAMTANKIAGALRRWALVAGMILVSTFGLSSIVMEIRAGESVWEILMKAIVLVGVFLSTLRMVWWPPTRR